ncbi:MAG: hypothetical protein JWO31_2545 [Phycisphaerales bacterium]|nr:hypothetical protein [Phycisphaerales bacterium]
MNDEHVWPFGLGDPAPAPPWSPEPGATEDAVDALRRAAPIELPSAYLNHLRQSNGGEGVLAVEPGYAVLWPAEEVIGSNRDIEVERWAPGLFAFGGNGGGELLAFDTRRGEPYAVVMVPLIGLALEDATVIAEDFEQLTQSFGIEMDVG